MTDAAIKRAAIKTAAQYQRTAANMYALARCNGDQQLLAKAAEFYRAARFTMGIEQ